MQRGPERRTTMRRSVRVAVMVAVACASVVNCYARLGESLSELTARYGQPVPQERRTPEQIMDPDINVFMQSGVHIVVWLTPTATRGRVAGMIRYRFPRLLDATSGVVTGLLENNREGSSWGSGQRMFDQLGNLKTYWYRADGGKATFIPEERSLMNPDVVTIGPQLEVFSAEWDRSEALRARERRQR